MFQNRSTINLAICSVSFFLSIASYKLNSVFDTFALYTSAINLIFIPAGFKLLCLLIGGEAAAVGLLLSSIYMSILIWNNAPLLQMTYFAFASVGTYYLTVSLIKKRYRIDNLLHNLRYVHVMLMAVCASVMHGVLLNTVYVWQEKYKPEDFLSNTSGMVLGDFLGCLIVIVLLNACVDMAFLVSKTKQENEQKGVRFIAQLLYKPTA